MVIAWKEVCGFNSEGAAMIKIMHMYVVKEMSLREIEAHFGSDKVTHRTIARMLVSQGVKMRPRGGRNYFKDVYISNEEYLNLTYKELCEKYKISSVTVRKLTKQYPPKPRLGRQPAKHGDDPVNEFRGPRRR